jgi:hypothetical protein
LGFGNLEKASQEFRRAERSFAEAAGASKTGVAGAVGVIPVIGRNVDVAHDIAAAGADLAAGVRRLTGSIASLPDGLGSLAPTNGALPLDALDGLHGAVDEAATAAEDALTTVQGSPSSLLLGPVASARSLAEDQLEEAARALRAGEMLLHRLPAFLGAKGPRRYFFVAENPTELRGTGGLWGAYSIMTVKDGRIRFGPFTPTQRLTELEPDEVKPPPNADYLRNYRQYGAPGFWLNMNMTPDFPSAAQAVLTTYRLTEGDQLDGVVAADPFVLRSLLEITGPTQIPGLGARINADNVIDFTSVKAYERFGGRNELRKDVLGDVASGVFEEFLAMDGRNMARLRALGEAVADGHVKIYANDRRMREALALAHADSSLSSPSGDLLAVVVNSGSGTKIDYWARREVSYEVQLGGRGEAKATTDVTLSNSAPKAGMPRYLIGPNLEGADAGDQVSILTVFCPKECDLEGAERDGKKEPVSEGTELGTTWYQDYLTVPSGESSTFTLRTFLKGVWEGSGAGGSYRLTFLNQTTIRPTHLRLVIHAPSGTIVQWASEPMKVDGGTAVWEGTPSPRMELEIRFSAPQPLRLWRQITGILG